MHVYPCPYLCPIRLVSLFSSLLLALRGEAFSFTIEETNLRQTSILKLKAWALRTSSEGLLGLLQMSCICLFVLVQQKQDADGNRTLSSTEMVLLVALRLPIVSYMKRSSFIMLNKLNMMVTLTLFSFLFYTWLATTGRASASNCKSRTRKSESSVTLREVTEFVNSSKFASRNATLDGA